MKPFLPLCLVLVTTSACIDQGRGTGRPQIEDRKLSAQTAKNMPVSTVEAVNLARFPYSQKSQFKSEMGQHLHSVDHRIGEIESRLPQIQKSATSKKSINALEAKRMKAHSQLKGVDHVPAQSWEKYKTDFRDAVADLERSVNQTSTAVK